MADTGIFVGWTRPVTGKERVAVELFGGFTSFLARLQKDGRIDSFEPVMLDAHGGDLNGFILVRGDREKLQQLQVTDEYRTFVTRGTIALQGFGQIRAHVGAGVPKMMDLYQKNI